MKKHFEEAKQQNPDDFKRDIGISLDNFMFTLSKVEKHIKQRQEKNPNLIKGVKPSIIIEDKLLLTMYYLRHYITFKNLGDIFDISESYANKIYHYILNILIEELHVSGSKKLMEKELDTIIIDVSEQEIERPIKQQKKYYSGKKKDIPLKFR